jgi:hypothetical protein
VTIQRTCHDGVVLSLESHSILSQGTFDNHLTVNERNQQTRH